MTKPTQATAFTMSRAWANPPTGRPPEQHSPTATVQASQSPAMPSHSQAASSCGLLLKGQGSDGWSDSLIIKLRRHPVTIKQKPRRDRCVIFRQSAKRIIMRRHRAAHAFEKVFNHVSGSMHSGVPEHFDKILLRFLYESQNLNMKNH